VVLPLASAGNHGSFGVHHGRRYAAYDYDLTTPQFTPDGRLLQVEYATKACLRKDSNPIVSVGLSSPGGSDTVLIMATISQPPPSPTSLSTIQTHQNSSDVYEQLDQQDEDEVSSLMKGENQRAQFRIIEVPLSVCYSSSLHYTTTSTILVGLSGLLSDATALLHIIYSHLEEEQRMMGWHRLGFSPVGTLAVDKNNSSTTSILSKSMRCQPIFSQPSETALRLSRVISDKCQKHAFGGGLRPLGASLLISGVDTLAEGNINNRMVYGTRVAMCETHPNGGWRKSVTSYRHNVNFSSQVMVTGGSIHSQHRLKRLVQDRLEQYSLEESSNPIDNISSILEHDKLESRNRRKMLRTIISSLVEEWTSRGDRSKSLPMSLPQMEVVISSSKRGSFRLNESDVARIMRPD
jgi:hypothetical protein